jgi:hypothetical protein
MGFFDVYCQVSGISSFGHDLEGALLIERGGKLSPLCPLVRGASDRLGGIDLIKADEVLDRSFKALEKWIDEGRLVLDVPYKDLMSLSAYRARNAGLRDGKAWAIHGFEWLFSVLSYGTWNGAVSLRHGPHPVRACLAVPRMIDAAVETVAQGERPGWAALRKDRIEIASAGALLDLAFDAGSEARDLYARVGEKLADERPFRLALARLARLRAFLNEHGGPRAPRTTQSDEDPAAAEACYRALGAYPAFRPAIAELYPALYAERLAVLDKPQDAQAGRDARPYDPKGRYKEGDVVVHPRFGEGVVASDSHEGKVAIVFDSGSKTLVCAR